jgi:hypothetical protein
MCSCCAQRPDGIVATGASDPTTGGLSDVVGAIVQVELGERVNKLEKVLKAEVEARILGEKQLSDDVQRGFQQESQCRDDQFRFYETGRAQEMLDITSKVDGALTTASRMEGALSAVQSRLDEFAPALSSLQVCCCVYQVAFAGFRVSVLDGLSVGGCVQTERGRSTDHGASNTRSGPLESFGFHAVLAY